MKISFLAVVGVMVLAMVGGCASQKPVSKFDLSTPEKTFQAWVRAVDAYDEKGAAELFSAQSAKAAEMRNDILESVFSARHFRRVMEAWFPQSRDYIVEDPGDTQHIKAMRDMVRSVTITVKGDRATVSGGMGAAGRAQAGMGFLIQRGGEWRFDLDRSPEVEEYPVGPSARTLHQAALMGPELRDVARQVERGRLTSVEEVKKELATRMNGVGG
jgi:hypothetical protein